MCLFNQKGYNETTFERKNGLILLIYHLKIYHIN